jgi:hypothetical protein
MALERHLLLTFGGGYVASSLVEETWMNTLRLVLSDSLPAPVGVLDSGWDVVATTINRTETDWTITGNWHAVHTINNFAPDDFLNDQVAPALAAWMGAMPGLTSQARLDWAKLYPIGSDGRAIPAPPYATGTPCELNWTSSNPVGGSSAQQLPLQISGVISHRTAQVGRPGRGRMFVPALTSDALNHDSTFKSTWASTAANVQCNTLEAVQIDGGIGGGFWTYPIVTGGNWTKYAIINQVSVGNIPDTQRRRRRALTETRVNQSPAY